MGLSNQEICVIYYNIVPKDNKSVNSRNLFYLYTNARITGLIMKLMHHFLDSILKRYKKY